MQPGLHLWLDSVCCLPVLWPMPKQKLHAGLGTAISYPSEESSVLCMVLSVLLITSTPVLPRRGKELIQQCIERFIVPRKQLLRLYRNISEIYQEWAMQCCLILIFVCSLLWTVFRQFELCFFHLSLLKI
jgi:type II secretory pathway component PulF